jgi:LmbE family N-acetylglucosaminyl deacetylase
MADATADLLPQSWDDVDRWLLAEARELIRLRVEPETAAYVMHQGEPTMYIRTPPLRDDEDEQIGRALANLVHPLRPDQVLLTYPDDAVDQRGTLTATLRALAGTREGGWRGVQVPLPYDDPREPVVSSEATLADDWTAHVRAIFDDAPPPPPDLSKVHHLEDDFFVAVNPDSPGAALLRQATADAEAVADRR